MTDFGIPWLSLLGGMLIGGSAIILMLFTGKTAGISGIFNGILDRQANGSGSESRAEPTEWPWRVVFLVSLAVGGVLASGLLGGHIPAQYSESYWLVLIAGGLVGVGTRLANGCTSGHGICGIGRFSLRSVVATAVFMASAMLTVWGLG